LENWERRGHVTAGLTKDQADCLIRADGLKGDNTNGFFVSYFERKRIAGSEGSGTFSAYKMPTIEGLEVYGGQFDVPSDGEAELPTISSANRKSKKVTDSKQARGDNNKGKKRKAGDETETSGGAVSADGAGSTKRSKKALKKLAWKKKQMEQRAKRLEKNKQSSSK
jgi:hypothetical protein